MADNLVLVDLPRPSAYFSVSGSWINEEDHVDGGSTRTGEVAVDVKQVRLWGTSARYADSGSSIERPANL